MTDVSTEDVQPPMLTKMMKLTEDIMPAQSAQLSHGDATPAGVRRASDVCSGPRAGAPATDGQPSTAARTPQWSGCVRCGVNELHDARAAVRRILRRLVSTFCQRVPLTELHRLLSLHLSAVDRMLASFRPPPGQAAEADAEPDRRDGGRVPLHVFKGRVVVAVGSIVGLFADEMDAVADMHALRQLVRPAALILLALLCHGASR